MRLAACLAGALVATVFAQPAEASPCVGITFGAAPATNTTITPAGDEDCFTFTGAIGDRIRIRVVETSGTLFAVHFVRRPAGTTVCTADGSIETTCTLDVAGLHEVRVRDNAGTNTGNYRITIQRLNNPTTCPALAFGAAPTAKNLTIPGQMHCVTFTGANADRIRLRILKTDDASPLGPQTEFIRPDGTTICNAQNVLERSCSLDAAGSHRILIRDNAGINTGEYRIQIQRLNNPSSCTALATGAAPSSHAITTPPEMDCFTFMSASDDQVRRFRLVETTGSLFATMEVVGPDGSTICNNDGSTEVTCTLGPSGTHRLIVRDNNGANTGDYNLSMQRLDSPTGCTALTYGAAPTLGSIDVAGEMDCFSVPGANLDDLRIRIIKADSASSLSPQTEVVRANGTTICNAQNVLERTCTFDSGGQHRIIVRDGVGAGTSTGDYRLQVQRLNNPLSCTELVSGDPPISQTITTPPEMDCFTFNAGSSNQVRRFRLVETSGALFATMEVIRPDGTTVCANDGSTEVTCTLGGAGNYRLIVRDNNGANTGNYRLTMQRLDAPTGCVDLAYGAAPKLGNITTAGELDCFSVAGASADYLRIRIIKASPAAAVSPQTDVIRPDGTTICNLQNVLERTCVLDAAGAHRILVRDGVGAGTATGGYRITVQRLNNPLSCPNISQSLNASTNGILTAPKMVCYSYNALAPGPVKIRWRLIETSGDLFASVEVVRPDGTTVCQVDGSTQATCTLDTLGMHRLIIRDNSGPGVGSFGIGLRRTTFPYGGCASVLWGGNQATATVTNAGELDCYSIPNSDPPKSVRHTVTENAGASLVANQEIIGPDGTTVCGPTTNAVQDCTLTQDGMHILIIRDDVGTGTGGYLVNEDPL